MVGEVADQIGRDQSDKHECLAGMHRMQCPLNTQSSTCGKTQDCVAKTEKGEREKKKKKDEENEK
jgi:hypothetical protein